MKKYITIIIIAIGLLSCTKEEKNPNIIFLLTDDQRWDAIGYSGNPLINTPNIDKLAEQGVIFENAYVTTSICCVSRASILSGQYASRHGIHDFHTDFSDSAMLQTYPLLMKEKAGYQIGFIGKYGIGLKGHPKEKFDYWGCEKVHQPKYENFDSAGNMQHYTDIVNGRITECLQQFSENGPFCLSVSFKAPHVEDRDPRQFIYHERYSEDYQDMFFSRPEHGKQENWDRFSAEFRKNNEARKRWKIRFETDSLLRESVRGYYRLIQGVDDVVGNITQQLNDLGIADNTIIVFMGDNGFFLGEHGMAGKWYPYNESVRVPLFIYNPKAAEEIKGSRIDKMALNIDIAPTLLQYAGVEIPENMQGEALQNSWNSANSWRDYFFYEHRLPNPRIPKSEAIIGLDYKYIEYYELPDSNLEFYDLTADKQEVVNLGECPEHIDLVTDYKDKLDSLRIAVK